MAEPSPRLAMYLITEKFVIVTHILQWVMQSALLVFLVKGMVKHVFVPYTLSKRKERNIPRFS